MSLSLLSLAGLHRPQVRGPENEAAFATLDRMLNLPRQVRAPSPARRVVEFICPCDAFWRPYRPEPVRTLAVGVCSPRSLKCDLIVESDELPPVQQNFVRLRWCYGEPAPTILAELGVEVLPAEEEA